MGFFFFEKIGLEYLDDSKYKDRLQSVTADYLPDDLIAAPAYGQVGAIIAAAAATGAQIKMTDDKSLYPVILGRQFQFDFRRHPTLGIIGAYSQYTLGVNDENTHTDQKDGARYTKSEVSTPPGKLSLAMKHCRGDIGLEEGMITSFKGVPRTSLNLYKEPHRFQLIERLGDRNRSGDHSLPSLNGLNDVDAYCPIIIFFLAATPAYAPSLFPASILKTKLPLTLVGLNGKYWSAPRLGAFHNSMPPEWPIGQEKPTWEGFHHDRGHDVVLSVDDFDKDEDYDDYHWVKLGYLLMKCDHTVAEVIYRMGMNQRKDLNTFAKQPQASKNQENKIDREKHAENDINTMRKTREGGGGACTGAVRGDAAVLHVCINFLRDPCAFLEWFATSSAENQAQTRRRVHRQLLEVQGWLGTKERKHVNSRLLLLCKTTVILLKAQRAADEDLLPKPFSGPEAPSCLHSHHSNALDQLRDLLKSFGLDEKTSHHVEKIRDFSKENEIGWEGNDMPSEHREYIKLVRDKITEHRSALLRYFSYQDLVSQCYVNIYCILERLAIVVACDSSLEDSCPEWERLKELESPYDDTDDVIIYRCLMLAILYRTAPDSEKMLRSGIWDQVVPII